MLGFALPSDTPCVLGLETLELAEPVAAQAQDRECPHRYPHQSKWEYVLATG
jgi:hypothetical protein